MPTCGGAGIINVGRVLVLHTPPYQVARGDSLGGGGGGLERRHGRLNSFLAAVHDGGVRGDVRPHRRGVHSFRFQLNLSSSIHRVTQIN